MRYFNPWTPAFDYPNKYLDLQFTPQDSSQTILSFIQLAIKQNDFDIEVGSSIEPDCNPLCKRGVPLALLWLKDMPQDDFMCKGKKLANQVFAQEPAQGLIYNIHITSKEVLVGCFLRYIPGQPHVYVSPPVSSDFSSFLVYQLAIISSVFFPFTPHFHGTPNANSLFLTKGTKRDREDTIALPGHTLQAIDKNSMCVIFQRQNCNNWIEYRWDLLDGPPTDDDLASLADRLGFSRDQMLTRVKECVDYMAVPLPSVLNDSNIQIHVLRALNVYKNTITVGRQLPGLISPCRIRAVLDGTLPDQQRYLVPVVSSTRNCPEDIIAFLPHENLSTTHELITNLHILECCFWILIYFACNTTGANLGSTAMWYTTTDPKTIIDRRKNILKLMLDGSSDNFCLGSSFSKLIKAKFKVVLFKLDEAINKFPPNDFLDAFESSLADFASFPDVAPTHSFLEFAFSPTKKKRRTPTESPCVTITSVPSRGYLSVQTHISDTFGTNDLDAALQSDLPSLPRVVPGLTFDQINAIICNLRKSSEDWRNRGRWKEVPEKETQERIVRVLKAVYAAASEVSVVPNDSVITPISSYEATVPKLSIGIHDMKEPKNEPDILILGYVPKNAPKGSSKKILVPYSGIISCGEVKPKNTDSLCRRARQQLLRYIRACFLSQLDRTSIICFLILGNNLTVYYADREGIAQGPEYDITQEQNEHRFVNDALLFTGLFHSSTIRDVTLKRHSSPEPNTPEWSICGRNIDEVLYSDRGGIAARSPFVVRVEERESDKMKVIKDFWPNRTVDGEDVEVNAYKTLAMGDGCVHLPNMVSHVMLRSTSELRATFGIRSPKPRMHVRITLDRFGIPLYKYFQDYTKKVSRTKKGNGMLKTVFESLLATLEACEHLNSLKLIHGDISNSNIFVPVHPDDKPFLSDLGLAMKISESWRYPSGTPEFVSGRILQAAIDKAYILVSPNDDIESILCVFLWVIKYAGIFHDAGGIPKPLKSILEVVLERQDAICCCMNHAFDSVFAPIFRHSNISDVFGAVPMVKPFETPIDFNPSVRRMFETIIRYLADISST